MSGINFEMIASCWPIISVWLLVHVHADEDAFRYARHIARALGIEGPTQSHI